MIKLRSVLVVMVVLVGVASVEAVESKPWTLETGAHYREGKSERVVIDGRGRLMLGAQRRQYAIPSGHTPWCAVQGAEGELLIGTGRQARVYACPKILDDGTAEARLFASLDGTDVFCLIEAPQGGWFAGTGPNGVVYHINTDGASRPFYETKTEYVWSLAIDSQQRLWVATGGSAELHVVDGQGKGVQHFTVEQQHFQSLVLDEPRARVIVGTAPGGMVLQVPMKTENKDQARVLFQSSPGETKSLALKPDGTIFAGVCPQVTIEPKKPDGEGGGESREKKDSQLVQISPAGAVRVLQTTDNELIHALVWKPREEQVLIGTSEAGRMYGLRPNDNRLNLFLDLESKQITTLAVLDDDLIVLGANPGEALVYGTVRAATGTYLSPVHDAQSSARWGAWRGVSTVPNGTSLTVATRSGNTDKPDEHWSEWSSEADATAPVQVTSPIGRYLQWRLTLGSEGQTTPVVYRVTTIYQQENLPPVLGPIQVGAAGADAPAPPRPTGGDNSAPGARAAGAASAPGASSASSDQPSPEVALRWTAQDPNDDKLQFVVSYRGEDEQRWKVLTDDLEQPSYTWDTTRVPDGRYLIQVEASDLLSNPPAQALTAQQVSETILVDNTPPEVVFETAVEQTSEGWVAKATARDQASRIVSAKYSLNSDDWVVVFPDKGIFDDLTASFTITLQDLKNGEHTLVLQVQDEKGHVGAAKRVFNVNNRASE